MQEAQATEPAARAAATRKMAAACAREQARLNALTWTAPPAEQTGSGTGPLAGFAAAVKANICGLGWPNDCASAILDGYRSPFDGDAVQRLRSAGCGFLGLTNMDEFGMGSSCEYTTYGPVRNPWNTARTAGGSSGGSAALVAAGLAWFALGSDTGGSVRLPAHCCGVVGLKPTYGRISRYGLIPFASSLDCVGVLARGVADAGLVLSVLAGPDLRDATCGGPALEWPPAEPGAAGTGLGVPRDLLEGNLDAEAAAEFERVLEVCRRIGFGVEDVRLDLPSDPVRIYLVLAAAEAASNLARYDGSLYGKRPSGDPVPGGETPYAGMVTGARSRGFGPEVRRRLLLGNHVLSAGARARFFTRAMEGRRALTGRMLRALERNPGLILPTAASGAFPLGERTADPVAMYRTDLFTVPASLAGLPALTLPTGLDSDGLPLSVQLVGRPGGDEDLLRMGLRLEAALDFRSRKEAPWRRTP